MDNLNQKIINILKQHPEGGEEFFNALDFMIRGDIDILDVFFNFVIGRVSSCTIILTGNFGITFYNRYREALKKEDVLLVNGGIRSGAVPIITRKPKRMCILLDDSFYSGTTRDRINEEIKNYYDSEIILTCVVYDGSKDKNDRVISLFRYYDNTNK